jgi:hypothetical protein
LKKGHDVAIIRPAKETPQQSHRAEMVVSALQDCGLNPYVYRDDLTTLGKWPPLFIVTLNNLGLVQRITKESDNYPLDQPGEGRPYAGLIVGSFFVARSDNGSPTLRELPRLPSKPSGTE